MEHTQEIRVLYADTDSYGVVWHGSYIKWFEAGRVGVLDDLGYDICELEDKGILFPVVDMNVRYKSSAKMNERILVKTRIIEVKPLSVTFEQNVYEKETNTLRVSAKVTIVAINPKTGKLYRRMPEELLNAFKKAEIK